MKYPNRILEERTPKEDRVDPRFVLRLRVLKEVTAKVEKDVVSGRTLDKVLEVRFRERLVAMWIK